MLGEGSGLRNAIGGWVLSPQRIGLIALMLLALAHGAAYALIVPIWQAPDETTLYEYAQLIVELGRIPRPEDRSPALEERLIASMERRHFWTYTLGIPPPKSLHTLADVQAIFDMPRQVGGDPPVYFALAALPLSLAQAWSPERQVLLLRMLNVLLLPGIVACTYGAAQEVVDDQPALALAAAGLVALQPMLIFIGASLSNDGLANLLGAALCWAFMRFLRYGFSPRRMALIVCLLALALLTKRTVLPYLALLPVLAWLARWADRPTTDEDKETRRQGDREIDLSVIGYRLAPDSLETQNSKLKTQNVGQMIVRWALPIAAVAIVAVWLGQQLDWGGAADWYNAQTGQPAARASVEGRLGAALLVRAGDELIHPLPASGTDILRGQTLRYGAHLWSDGGARGRLIVYTGDERQEFPFEVRGPLDMAMQAVVPEQAPNVLFGLVADSGSFYADDVWANGQRPSGNLITNSWIEWPAVRPDTPLNATLNYLRLRDVVWTLQSGRLAQPLAGGDIWAGLLFDTFWGFFGWMRQPYVSGSIWRPLLAACCALGVLGTLRWLLWRRGPARQRRQVLALLLLASAALAIMLINAYALPSIHAPPQGRYLFPMLPAIACIMALGQSALLPRGWFRPWLAGWFAFWLLFAGATLAYLASYYA
jgi:hypothetical protein